MADRRPQFTCAGCSVRVRYLPGFGPASRYPVGWAKEEAGLLCLGCRRKAAGEGESTPSGRRRAIVRFELERDPSRRDGAIAKALGVSRAVVSGERKKVGRG